jgi:uncharacterized membrane protein
MDPRDRNDDGQIEKRESGSSWLSAKRLALIIIGLQILLAVVAYPFMPERVPSHWNMLGQVNGYMPRFWSAVFLPGMSIVLYVVLRGLVILGPRLGSVESQQILKKYVDRFLVVLLLFLLVVQGTTTGVALGYRIDVVYVINVAAGLMFIVLGNYMGKIQRNFWAGIRTPWTLASDVVWERTHRVGGWLIVLSGMVTIVMNFFAPLRAIALVGPLLVVMVIVVVYSYVVYQRLEREGGEKSLGADV